MKQYQYISLTYGLNIKCDLWASVRDVNGQQCECELACPHRGGAGGGRDMNTLYILGHPGLSRLPHFMHYGPSSPSHTTARNNWAPSNHNHSWPSSILLCWLHLVPLCVSITTGGVLLQGVSLTACRESMTRQHSHFYFLFCLIS